MSRANVFVAVQFVLLGLLVALSYGFAPVDLGVGRWLGFGLIALALLLMLWAIQAHASTNQNTPRISPVPNDRAQLVTSGAYRFARHPIYSAVLSGTLGACFTHGHWTVFVVWGVLAVFFTVKARYEEQLLSAVYPDYGAYMQRVGRFTPFW